ncbi:MAG TPA: CoA pyrophosphatase [Tissierellaceae bacterium]|nr:CoA pyrophosphatase [Tissierellaceae bacterium]
MLDIDYIEEKIKRRSPKSMERVDEFAVLIPIINNNGKWELIYELRAMDMKSQPGEVSFPGGRVEEGETFRQAALRETIEELNIEEKNIRVLGELDYLISYAHLEIHCFLAVISGVVVDKIIPNPTEVDHLFTVPLEFILNNEPKGYNLELETKYSEEFPFNLIPNGKNYSFRKSERTIYFYEYGDYIIWGYTATMTKHLAELLKDL